MIKQLIQRIKLKLERRALVRELDTLLATRQYIARREQEIMQRAAQIDCENISVGGEVWGR